MEQYMKLTGKLLVETRKKDGTVIEREEKDNLIVTAGKVWVAKLIGGVETTCFDAIALGTDATAAAVGQTALLAEVKRETVTGAYEATAKIAFEHTFDFDSGETYSLREACVIEDTSGAGAMLNRVVFTEKAVDVDTDLYVKFTITVA